MDSGKKLCDLVRPRLCGVAIGLVTLLTSCAPTLAGRLIGPGGEIVTSPDARVNVTSLASAADAEPVIHVTTVDSSGRFSTDEGLGDGEWLIEALVPGYAVSSARIKAPHKDELKLTLTPMPRSKAAPVGANPDVKAGRGAGGATLTPPQL
jgi:hypothetical protein